MRWEAWVLFVNCVLNLLCTPALVGRERQPLEPAVGSVLVVFYAFEALIILRLAGVA